MQRWGLSRPAKPGSWVRVAAFAVALVFIGLAGAASWIVWTQGRAVDYLSFWAAGKLALEGSASLAYDLAAHKQVEAGAVPITGELPFPYPPPFLFVVSPFSAFGYPLGFTFWVVVTGAVYIAATRRVAAPTVSVAQPAALANALIGQNGFLTSAVFVGGMELLGRRPVLAGGVLGLMVIKPQLALLLPLALIGGKHWRALVASACSAALLLLAALLVFGTATYQGFAGILPFYTEALHQSRWPWNELSSPFAFARFFGVQRDAALLGHVTIAFGAAAITWRAWRQGRDARIPLLAAATMLIPPYIFTYDSLFLVVPVAWLLARKRYAIATVVWILCLLPVVSYFGLYWGPNTIPLAALLTMWELWRNERLGGASAGAPRASPISS